ncbi:MAG: response regulator transcription factor [Acidiferrobacterales bacterium]
MRILVIEDHRDLVQNICEFLEPEGHVVDYAGDGITGLHLALVNDYDVIVLDLTLPAMDGITLCQKFRSESKKNTPVLMLTARDTVEDKLQGFSAGTDDYLVKPFSLLEMKARLEALQRRGRESGTSRVIVVGDLQYDPDTLSVQRAGQPIHLNRTNRRILSLLMQASHRVVTREEIEREIWGDNPPDSDVLRAHVYALRRAIDKPFATKLLRTIHGVGYRLASPDEL